ncbi:hypothetical protein IWX47DRAFT_618619 [Phyllosticta citricarpa]
MSRIHASLYNPLIRTHAPTRISRNSALSLSLLFYSFLFSSFPFQSLRTLLATSTLALESGSNTDRHVFRVCAVTCMHTSMPTRPTSPHASTKHSTAEETASGLGWVGGYMWGKLTTCSTYPSAHLSPGSQICMGAIMAMGHVRGEEKSRILVSPLSACLLACLPALRGLIAKITGTRTIRCIHISFLLGSTPSLNAPCLRSWTRNI